jgi:hypothetical protein
MITIPLPIPVPTITIDGNEVRINKVATELAKRQRQLGELLTFDDEKSLPICCACKEPKAHMSTFEPPEGFRWGGWFCDYCLGQGRLAKRLNLVIDQVSCDIEPVLAFDQKGMPHNVV